MFLFTVAHAMGQAPGGAAGQGGGFMAGPMPMIFIMIMLFYFMM